MSRTKVTRKLANRPSNTESDTHPLYLTTSSGCLGVINLLISGKTMSGIGNFSTIWKSIREWGMHLLVSGEHGPAPDVLK